MHKQVHRGKTLRLEELEPRWSLAATAYVNTEGTLLAFGTTGNDTIRLEKLAAAGQWRVTIGRTVWNLAGVTDDVQVYSRQGTDTITVQGIAGAPAIAGDLRLVDYGGPTTIRVADVAVAGSVVIKADDADDIITLANLDVGGALTVATLNGNDRIDLGASVALNAGQTAGTFRTSDIAGAVSLHAGWGYATDKFTLFGVSFGGDSYLRGGRGDNEFNLAGVMGSQLLRLYGDADVDLFNVGWLDPSDADVRQSLARLADVAITEIDDYIAIAAQIVPDRNLSQYGIAQMEDLALQGVWSSSSTYLYGGGGADYAGLRASTIQRPVRIFMGDGDDRVEIEECQVTRTLVLAGEGGNDIVSVQLSSVTVAAYFDGGPGEQDSLSISESTAGSLDYVNFEDLHILEPI